MTSFACFLAWLLQLPPVIRLSIAASRLLGAILDVLIDPETRAVRELEAWALDGLERSLQTAEACVARATWLRARQIAGLPQPGRPAPFRYLPPRRSSAPEAMAMRACRLLDRLARLDSVARRMAQSMTVGAHLSPNLSSEARPANTLGAPSNTVLLTLAPSASTFHERTARGPARQTGPPRMASFPFQTAF